VRVCAWNEIAAWSVSRHPATSHCRQHYDYSLHRQNDSQIPPAIAGVSKARMGLKAARPTDGGQGHPTMRMRKIKDEVINSCFSNGLTRTGKWISKYISTEVKSEFCKSTIHGVTDTYLYQRKSGYTKHLFYQSLYTPARHGHCQLLTRDVWRHSI